MNTPALFVSVHRWLGVVLCLLVAAWFASGAVLMYVPFPSLADEERLAAGSDVDAFAVTISASDAIRAERGLRQPIARLRLVSRGARPVYILEPRGGPLVAIWADDGRPATIRSAAEAGEVAKQFSDAPIERIDGPLDFDQWVVHQGFNLGRPYYRVRVDDAVGTVLYISQRSGEVLQRTLRNERAWNYVGAVTHWIYPTVLRRHWAAWDQVVWWLSLVGICVVGIGIWLGIDRMLGARRSRAKKLTPFRGWMKWHHLLGLVAGLFVLTWIFSGWLSMDHGRIFAMPDASDSQIDRSRGITLVQAARDASLEFIHGLGKFRELEISAVDGSPIAIVRAAGDQRICYLESVIRCVSGLLPRPLIVSAVRRAWPQFDVLSADDVAQDDAYRQVRQSRLPATTIRVKLNDPDRTWVQVDAASGEIMSVEDRGRRSYRWLYHGLHSWDYPGLVNRRPLWDVVVLSLLTLGFSFSITGAYLGLRRLKRSIAETRTVR